MWVMWLQIKCWLTPLINKNSWNTRLQASSNFILCKALGVQSMLPFLHLVRKYSKYFSSFLFLPLLFLLFILVNLIVRFFGGCRACYSRRDPSTFEHCQRYLTRKGTRSEKKDSRLSFCNRIEETKIDFPLPFFPFFPSLVWI